MFMGLSESVSAPCGAATLTGGARRTRAPARATEEKVLGLVTHHPSCPSLATGEAYLLSPLSESLSPGRASRNCRTGFLFAKKATLRPWPVEMASPLPREPKQLALTHFLTLTPSLFSLQILTPGCESEHASRYMRAVSGGRERTLR
jgi:hypothetical protein